MPAAFLFIAVALYAVARMVSSRLHQRPIVVAMAPSAACWLVATVLSVAIFLVLGLPTRAPPQVIQVLPGSPADRAGLQAGDVLISVAGHPVVSAWKPTMAFEGDPHSPVAIDEVKRLAAAAAGGDLAIVVRRGANPTPFSVRADQGRIGIAMDEPVILAHDPPLAIYDGLLHPFRDIGHLLEWGRWLVTPRAYSATGLDADVPHAVAVGQLVSLADSALVSVALVGLAVSLALLARR